MSRERIEVALIVLVLLIVLQSNVSAQTNNQFGSTQAIFSIDLSCYHEQNSSCDVHQVSHIIEYFGAEWCEPCDSVSPFVNNMSSDDIVVVQHSSSISDETWLSQSSQRFSYEYRLLLYPSLVIDGTTLLTGTRQATMLNESILNSTANWSVVEGLVMNGTTITWENQLNATVTAWVIEPTMHGRTKTVQPFLAVNAIRNDASSMELNLSSVDLSNATSIVLMFETPGIRNLTTKTILPITNAELENHDVNLSGGSERSILTPIIWSVVLILCILPAIYLQLSDKETLSDGTMREAE